MPAFQSGTQGRLSLGWNIILRPSEERNIAFSFEKPFSTLNVAILQKLAIFFLPDFSSKFII